LNSCRKCELERVTMTATEVSMDVTGAMNADAVDDKSGLSIALMPSPVRAWRRMSNDPDAEVEKWLEKGGLCSILVTPVNTGVFAPAPERRCLPPPSRVSWRSWTLAARRLLMTRILTSTVRST